MKDKPLIDKSFKNWTREDLQTCLGITRQKNFKVLEDWLNMEVDLTKEEIDFLEVLRENSEDVIDLWNEAELRENFISELTKKVNFRDRKKMVSNFAERYFSITIEKESFAVKLHGFVDWLVARGIGKPKRPYFFIHEYKPAEGQTTDGKGQLLAAMYAVQHLNAITPSQITLFEKVDYNKNMPIYGVYIIGSFWYFVALQGNKYGISRGHISPEKEDLQTIFKLLKAQKQLIFDQLKTNVLKAA